MASATPALASPAVHHTPARVYLRNPRFDLTLVVWVAVVALAAGVAVVVDPFWFWPIVFVDVWVLGSTHVVSTFSRMAFDRDSFRQHWPLLIPLPLAVAACTVAMAIVGGQWLIATVYLYAQWFHYMRQSYGISRMFLRKSGALPASRDWVLDGVIYGLPVWGILSRSHEHPQSLLTLPIYTFPVPAVLLYAVAGIACVSMAWWVVRELRAIAQSRPTSFHSAYVASHIAVFAAGYLIIPDISSGWLVMNTWHNLQYVLIVWMSNARRFEQGVDRRHLFLSTISQPENVVLYALVCWAIATVLYINIGQIVGHFSQSVLQLPILASMTINFHHYVVDAIIWRRPRSPKPVVPSAQSPA